VFSWKRRAVLTNVKSERHKLGTIVLPPKIGSIDLSKNAESGTVKNVLTEQNLETIDQPGHTAG
jgi:hypothetical protein